MGTTNFDLGQSVDNYIRSVINQGSISASDAAELTSHLYDSIDSLKNQGLSEEESFVIASKRLGDESILTEEYAKVNPTVHNTKIWAYLLLGYNLLYKLPSLIFLLIAFFYIKVHEHLHSSGTAIFIIVTFHLMFIAGIYYLVRQKNQISGYIEKQVHLNPVRIVCLSFLPFIFLFLAKPVFKIPVWEWDAALVNYPLRKFNSSLIEFSFLAAVLSIIAGILFIIFSIRVSGKLNLRSLFENPSILFLVLFGVLIELLAASTRALNFPFDTELIRSDGRLMLVEGHFNKTARAISFGMIYFIGGFLITYFNKHKSVNQYLLIFLSFGLIVEIGFGIRADLGRGGTIYTVYFVCGMLLAIILGKAVGSKMKNIILIN